MTLNRSDSGNSDNDRDSSMDSDAARKNVSSEVNVPPVSYERNAVLPSERSLRPRCSLKQPSKLRDYVLCSCDIRYDKRALSLFVLGKCDFLIVPPKLLITYLSLSYIVKA